MVNVSDISCEDELAKILVACGYASETPSLSPTWEHLQLLRSLSLARHLTDAGYKNIYVAVEGTVIQIYSWVMLVCELSGAASEEELIAKIKLTASPDSAPDDPSKCICLNLPLPFDHYEKVRFVGRDDTHGRFGEVTLKRCRHCQRYWLHYFVEYEAYRRSGRYFMGLITAAAAETMTAEMAVDYLGNLDWHLYGGSYFDNRTGKSMIKGIDVDC